MRAYGKVKSEAVSIKQSLITAVNDRIIHKSEQTVFRIGAVIAALLIFLLSGLFFIKVLAQNTSSVPVYKYYTSIPIEKGDTLWSIAEEYLPEGNNADIVRYIQEIKELNHLSDDKILEGNKLLVFYYSTEYK